MTQADIPGGFGNDALDKRGTGLDIFIQELLREIRDPIRRILANFIIFLVFFVISNINFLIFDWWTQDLQIRNSFFDFFMEGVEMSTAIVIAINFPISTIRDLYLPGGIGINK